ncbi:MAG: site-specific integrase [Actinophytocola sp.]|uniref:tyrosine-type recombinase/integrase n=1 Tax=Actinophytocola sp. TaxID=1872138 RepID=UPI003C786579
MAWPERLPSGKWRGGWREPNGDKIYTKKATHPEHPYPTRKAALDVAKEEEVKAARRASIVTGKAAATITWGDYWDTTRVYRQDTDTESVERSLVDLHVRPRWGEVPLNAILHRDVKRWALSLFAGREPSHARRIYGVFRASINRALDDEVLDASPCANIRLPKATRVAKPIKDDTRFEKIRPHLKPCYQDLVDFGYEMGLRPGEMSGLHLDAIDRASGWLTVDKTFVSRRGIIRHSPKDEDSRDVPLTTKATAIVDHALAGRDVREGCGLDHHHRGRVVAKPCRSPLVFLNEKGNPITAQAFWRALDRAADVAGVERVKPYDSRHWYITRALEGGLDIATVAYLVGHSDVKQTQDYAFRTAGVRDRVRAALGDRAPLASVDEPPVDTLRQGAVQWGHDGAMDHRTGS